MYILVDFYTGPGTKQTKSNSNYTVNQKQGSYKVAYSS